MSSIDSEAVFFALVAKFGLGNWISKFVECGWTTHGSFAFAANYTPGSADDRNLREEVLVKLTGQDDHAILAAVRRLHFESYTQYGQESKRQVEQVHDLAPRELPVAERHHRLESLKLTYKGLKIVGEVVPSDVVVDKYVQMQERGSLMYLPWMDIGRRDVEAAGSGKKEPYWQKNSQGILCERSCAVDTPADVSTSLRLSKMFQRRGFALELSRLMSYEAHETLVEWLMGEYERDPIAGFSRITLEQVEQADKEVFLRLGELTRGALTADPVEGTLPLDSVLPNVLTDVRIRMLLFPARLPATTRATETAHKRKADQISDFYEAPARTPKGPGKGKGKGKDTSKLKKAPKKDKPRMPPGMENMVGAMETPGGSKRICYGFNLPNGCQENVDKTTNSCSKGLHVCARKRCHGNHSAQHKACPEQRR